MYKGALENLENLVLVTNTHEKKQGEKERGGERERERKREKEEGVGRRWLRWPPSLAGGIPVTAVSPKNYDRKYFLFSIFQIKDGVFQLIA